MVRALLCVFAASAAVVGFAEPTTVVQGNIRVQVLSNSLVRIEQKGPRGFEDRKTFTVVNRSWNGSSVKKSHSKDGLTISTDRFKVTIPNNATSVDQVRVVAKKSGKPVTIKPPYTGQTYLPGPSDLPSAYVMADNPRMVPPPMGATPASLPAGDPLAETSGYDTRNDSPDVYVFIPENYTNFRSEYLKLTGPVPMVPRYTFGFWDSRWFAYSEETALETIDKYRKRGIPLDVFVVDTDWRVGGSDGYKPDPKYFPDMPRFLKRAHEKGVKVMFNDHPEPRFPTALDPRETQYRFDSLSSVLKMGMDVWWFDRNWWTSFKEPMPGIRKEVWGQAIFHDVTQRTNPGLRPMVMSNVAGIDNGRRNYAPHPASHRYPIWWTGDTGSTYEFLRLGIENGVDAGIYGLLPYINEDLGGHTGSPDDELYVRYLQFGCLSPVTRIHCTKNLTRYPWAYKPESEKLVTDSIKFRYRLIPTLYAASRKAYEDGTPLLRRLDLYYPQQKEAADNHQYLLGDDLLVAPVYDSWQGGGETIKGLLHTNVDQPGLKAEYFNNEKLEGEPVLRRVDTNVSFDWGGGSPDGVNRDHFSARWTGLIGPMPKSGKIRFGVTSDDGVRVWVNNKLIIDQWHPSDSTTYTGEVDLEANKSYPIRVEYYEIDGGAKCQLMWYPGTKNKAGYSKSSLWVPPGKWNDVWTGETLVGPKRINRSVPLNVVPLLVRQGAIILGGPDVQVASAQRGKSVIADVFAPAVGSQVTRTFYEDDGISVDYKDGKFIKRNLTASTPKDGRYLVQLAPATGSYAGQPKTRKWVVRFHLPKGADVKSVRINGTKAAVDGKNIRLEAPKGAPKTILGVLDATYAPVLVVELPKLGETEKAEVRVNLK